MGRKSYSTNTELTIKDVNANSRETQWYIYKDVKKNVYLTTNARQQKTPPLLEEKQVNYNVINTQNFRIESTGCVLTFLFHKKALLLRPPVLFC